MLSGDKSFSYSASQISGFARRECHHAKIRNAYATLFMFDIWHKHIRVISCNVTCIHIQIYSNFSLVIENLIKQRNLSSVKDMGGVTLVRFIGVQIWSLMTSI